MTANSLLVLRIMRWRLFLAYLLIVLLAAPTAFAAKAPATKKNKAVNKPAAKPRPAPATKAKAAPPDPAGQYNVSSIVPTRWPGMGINGQPATLLGQVGAINPGAVARALDDMARTWPDRIDAARLRARLGDLAVRRAAALEGLAQHQPAAIDAAQALVGEVRAALLANPLLDFDRILVLRRDARAPKLGLCQNWESNSSIPRQGIDNSIEILSGLRGEPKFEKIYQPPAGKFAGDLALHFDAGRFLFSSLDASDRWGVFEMDTAGGAPRQLPLIPDADVDNYTAAYLPDDSILFSSTAPFVGVPCVRGKSHVTNLYRYWPATGKIRRLTFDQEHNWCPTVLPDGRILYLRWEYSDLPHFVARILFTMNPDGTNQREFYGSGSYWPNAFFYARPMPGHPRQVAGIVTGHHGVPRMGELVVIDPALGRFEADGVVQRVPGWGKKVQPIILDNIADASWPKFLHPAPLSDKYILTACKPTTTSLWGIYFADVFDNVTLIKELPGQALLEPVPLMKSARPPVIPDMVKEDEKTARLQIADIYQGPGLADVPRGTIRKLRLVTYNFSYHDFGGQVDRVGLDGPWDIKRIIGTVPVEADGSAFFEVPACLPISIQPLDAKGRAVALMRSWTTAMPGETQSCVGCHERQNSASAASRNTMALRKTPATITPFYGPLRGFSFDREVQPVLDRYCVGCHNGQPRSDGVKLPDFRRAPHVFDIAGDRGDVSKSVVKFPPAYLALKNYVRNPTMENDIHTLLPYEFHGSTTELVQRLEAGHHGITLDAEAWDRLNTWIDLNTPAHGTWAELDTNGRLKNQPQRRRELTLRYAGLDDDTDAVYPAPDWPPQPPPAEPPRKAVAGSGLPPPPGKLAGIRSATQILDLGGGVNMTLVQIPAGAFVAGGTAAPTRRVKIDRPFWIGTCEVTNAQFARFNPRHDSRLEHGDFLHFSSAQCGISLNGPRQPVCHVSWVEARAFCQWLSARTGRRIALPAGDAWEYACRAGAATPMAYGTVAEDFSRLANLADVNLRRPIPFRAVGIVPEWRPAIATVNDGYWVSAPVGSYPPNAWGLYDMHGNVWEWTADAAPDGVSRLVRGGSWYVRPQRATADATLAYLPWQQVYDVGFRVVVE